MDVNQVRFSGYSINGFKPESEKNAKDETRTTNTANEAKTSFYSADDVLEALTAQGLYNKAQIIQPKEINPADYLNPERISDIEAAMAEFENGAARMALAIESEFPEMLTKAETNALAARMFAQE